VEEVQFEISHSGSSLNVFQILRNTEVQFKWRHSEDLSPILFHWAQVLECAMASYSYIAQTVATSGWFEVEISYLLAK